MNRMSLLHSRKSLEDAHRAGGMAYRTWFALRASSAPLRSNTALKRVSVTKPITKTVIVTGFASWCHLSWEIVWVEILSEKLKKAWKKWQKSRKIKEGKITPSSQLTYKWSIRFSYRQSYLAMWADQGRSINWPLYCDPCLHKTRLRTNPCSPAEYGRSCGLQQRFSCYP